MIKKKKKKEGVYQSPTTGEFQWKKNEDVALMNAVDKFDNNWDLISDTINSTMFPISTPRIQSQCKTRYEYLQENTSKKPLNEVSKDQKKLDLQKIFTIWKPIKEKKKVIKTKQEPFNFDVVKNEKSPLDYLNLLLDSNILDSPTVLNKIPPRYQPQEERVSTLLSQPLQQFVSTLNIKNSKVNEDINIILYRNDLQDQEKIEQIKNRINQFEEQEKRNKK